jgi:hypothetical protein
MDEHRSRLIQTIRNSADSKVDLLSIVGIDGDRRHGYALREWNITGDIREIRHGCRGSVEPLPRDVRRDSTTGNRRAS